MDEENTIEGFSLSGEEVANMSDTHFKIYAEPYYREFDSLDRKGESVKKLIIPIVLANGNKAEWIANKTSQKKIMAKKGRLLKEWIDFQGELVAREQVVGKETRMVIYLK